MRYIFGLLLFFGLNVSLFADQLVCSERVIKEITKGAIYVSSYKDFSTYMLNIKKIDNKTVEFTRLTLYTHKGRKYFQANKTIGFTGAPVRYIPSSAQFLVRGVVGFNCNADVLFSDTWETEEWKYISPGSIGEIEANIIDTMLSMGDK